MKQQIIDNINNPEFLEKLYRSDIKEFAKAFFEISNEYDSDLINFWKIRLSKHADASLNKFNKHDLFVLIVVSFLSGLVAKLPDFISVLDKEIFFQRNLPLIIFNNLILYIFWQNKIFDKTKIIFYLISILAILIFVNLLPCGNNDSVNLSIIHIPLIMWCFFGLSFISFDFRDTIKKNDFIKLNGELLIMSGLLILSGGLMTAITFGLFSAININIEKFYIENVLLFGGVAAPAVSYYLIRLYPNITSKISPVIAKVFTPLVFITLFVYLISFIFSEAALAENRDLLIIFNIMLIAVMAIIIFSVSEIDKSKSKSIQIFILFLLALMAVIIDLFALSAIITRLTYGFTPNRTVVFFSNLLIFINLILIAKNLFLSFLDIKNVEFVEKIVADYLTLYFAWTIFAIFLLPFIFDFQ